MRIVIDTDDTDVASRDYLLPRKPIYELAKRGFDIAGSLLGIVILSPVFVAIGIAVKTNSAGPIMYRGWRTGQYGRTFRIWKFRSMVVGADQGAGTTSSNDPRVTTVGAFIRRHKLDEIPQLFNVLAGDMSFVGPRPELPAYTQRYIGEERVILTVRPGITDYASIQFVNLNQMIADDDPDRVFEEQFLSEKNRLRIKYVRDRGFWLDLRLICHTLLRMALK